MHDKGTTLLLEIHIVTHQYHVSLTNLSFKTLVELHTKSAACLLYKSVTDLVKLQWVLG